MFKMLLKSKTTFWVVGAVLVALGLLFWPSISGDVDDSPVACLTSEVFHVHPELTVFVDGEQEGIPANLGVEYGCTRELHTHDSDGVIHVESAVDRGYEFSDFLWIWKKTLDRPGYSLVMTVDGTETTDPNFVLKDKQQIMLTYTKLAE